MAARPSWKKVAKISKIVNSKRPPSWIFEQVRMRNMLFILLGLSEISQNNRFYAKSVCLEKVTKSSFRL